MRKSLICSVLVACVAWIGCGSDDGESGGTGGNGPATAFTFDAETSRVAGATAGAAVALGIQLGDVVGNVLTTLGSELPAASSNTVPKVNVRGFCQAGSADAALQQSQPGKLAAGDVVTLTLDDCSGSPVSVMRSNGTIVLEMLRVTGGLPVIGGVITANATLDLAIDPDTTITGNFELRVDTPSLASANLFFGGSKSGDLITVTDGDFRAQLACFEIYQRVFFQSRAVEFFRAFGVLKQGNQVFTLNSYTETPDVIDFSFAGFDATPESGSLTLDSGDLSGGICSAFSGSPTSNDSFVTAIFTGGGCVSLDGTDTEGVPFSLTTTWDSLLEAGQPGTPSDECEGAGGTGGTGGTECPVPPLPAFDMSAPLSVTMPAVYDENLLGNPGFESSVRVGSAPDDFGYWRFDQSASVAAQQGITPREGGRMLHFAGTGRSDSVRGGSAEQVQLVDVSTLASAIDSESVEVEASAWFSRVAGCAQTDDVFGVVVMAFDGTPDTFATRWTNGVNAASAQGTSRDAADVSGVDAWLRHVTAQFRHNLEDDKADDVYGWRQSTATMEIPSGTRFVAIHIYASENVLNDEAFPELHGHYADDASLVLRLRD